MLPHTLLTSNTNQLKMNQRLKRKSYNYNIFRIKHRSTTLWLWIRQWSFRYNTKKQEKKKINYISPKLKIFMHQKKIIKVKSNLWRGRKCLQIMSDKHLIFKIYNELLQSTQLCDPMDYSLPGSSVQITHLRFLNGQRTWIDISPKINQSLKRCSTSCHLCVHACSVMSNSLGPQWDCSYPGSSVHGISQARINTGVGCHFTLQEIFRTQE